ncbi:MAG: hypothetical protein B6226_02700 [Candidatus Cloacimonetes bacterium 4572_65]|nr:MAG: hypothetical protein B6226_02700 [Candidatus Cloacimonetes bacterium 4572_65]
MENNNVSLRDVTKETLLSICQLIGTADIEKEKLIASNAIAIAQAYFNKDHIFKAIYNNDIPVGFVMMQFGSSMSGKGKEFGAFLLRYMIASPYQRQGFGKAAWYICEERIKARGFDKVFVAYNKEVDGSQEFLESLGFAKSGRFVEGKTEAILKF